MSIVHAGADVPTFSKFGAWYLLRGVDDSRLRNDSGAYAPEGWHAQALQNRRITLCHFRRGIDLS